MAIPNLAVYYNADRW